MPYREYQPHLLLRNFVACYWSSQNQTAQPHTVFPDACSDILFNFGDPMIIAANGVESRSEGLAFVIGTMTRSIHADGFGKQDLFGIRFKPGGISGVIREPQSAFTDNSIEINDCTHQMPNDLPDQLRAVANEERVEMIDRWLLEKLSGFPGKSSWWWAVNRIISGHGNIRIKDLALESAMSEKQLERKFLAHVGVTPKQLGTIARFCEAKRQLEQRHESLEGLAWDLGYTDHAHFTKSFRAFAGFAPSEFMKSLN